jgi:hypothetical protein
MPDEIQDPVTTQTTEPKTPSLAEWREAKNQPAADVSEASPEAESVPDAEAGDDHRSEESPDESKEAADKAEEPPKQGRRKLQEEVGYLRRRNREEREQLSREISELRTQLDSIRQSTPQDKPQETKAETGVPAMPSLGNYPSVEEWEGAVAKWIDQRDEARERQKTQASEQQRQQAEWNKAQQHWADVSEKAERQYPGFNEDVNSLIRRGNVSPSLGRTIVQESLDAPEVVVSVVRYLTQKPEEAKRISGLNEQRTVLEIGRLIERFTNPVIRDSGTAATKQPAVPARTTVLNGSGVQGKKLGENMSLQEFRQIKARQAAARH